MKSLHPINVKARRSEQQRTAPAEDVYALQNAPAAKKSPKVFYPVGCTLHFSPGWEVDAAGGTAGLCQPAERDLFDCYLGCAWPAQVPDHVSNNPDWTDKCAVATSDWRNIDVIYP